MAECIDDLPTPYTPACVLDFTTSVGTRIRHDTYSCQWPSSMQQTYEFRSRGSSHMRQSRRIREECDRVRNSRLERFIRDEECSGYRYSALLPMSSE
jgi:hypothetical protein